MLAVLAGCQSHEVREIEPSEIELYGNDPLYHTHYVGSDAQHHHLRWSRGKRTGEWLVDKTKLRLGCEFPLADSRQLLLEYDAAGTLRCP